MQKVALTLWGPYVVYKANKNLDRMSCTKPTAQGCKFAGLIPELVWIQEGRQDC